MTSSARQADLRSLALHAAVADAIRRDPTIAERARDRVHGWIRSPENLSRAEHARAWADILSRSDPDVANALVEDSERMQVLRSASPFAGALTPQERWRVLKEFNDA